MSDPENFLTRWSRRKRDVAKEDARAEAPVAEPADRPSAPDEDANAAVRLPAADAPQAPAFDLSKLPSLDSIGASSDITAFLQSGVPSELKHAALRRAWVADPAIRDFITPAENAWDFTATDAMPGFGELGPADDIKKLVAEVFRDAMPEAEAPAETSAAAPVLEQPAVPADKSGIAADVTAPRDAAAPQQFAATARDDSVLQRDKNLATQQDDSVVPSAARHHGGAMPR